MSLNYKIYSVGAILVIKLLNIFKK
jgi:hypothetical protein